MPKVSDEHREQRRAQIIEAAHRCMVERGIRGASMQDIIRESGLSAGAIYLHFESKQAIVLEAARRALTARFQSVIAGGETSGARFTDLMTAFIAGPSGGPDKGTFLLQWWSEATVDPEVREIVQTVVAMLGETYEEHLRAFAAREHGMTGDDAAAWAARLRPVTLGLLQGAIVQGALLDDFDAAAYLTSCEPLFAPDGTIYP